MRRKNPQYGAWVRLMLLLAGFAVGSAIVLIGVVRDSLAVVALGGLVAVLTGAALKQELSNERFAGVIHQGRGRLQLLVGHLRGRGPMAFVGGVAGLVVGELMLGWWGDLGMPVQCQDLFFPDPPLCGILSTLRAWIPPILTLVGLLLGWFSRGQPDTALKTTSRAVFEALGRLVATAALILGAIIVAPIAFGLPGYRQRPWLDLAAGLAALSGGLLYLIGLHRGRGVRGVRAVTARGVGWLLFATILVLPALTTTYLVRWWLQGVLLSAIALPAIPTWGGSEARVNRSFPPHPIDSAHPRTTDSGR